MEKVLMFLLKLLFGTVCSFFSTLSVTFLTLFAAQLAAFPNPKNLYYTEISSPYRSLRFMHFPTTLHLMKQLRRVRRAWKFYWRFLGYMHQFVRQSLQPLHTCHVHFHLHIFNSNCHLQLLAFITPHMNCILVYRIQIKIAFLFR